MIKTTNMLNNKIKDILRSFKLKYLNIEIYKLHYLKINININDIICELHDFDLNVKELSYEDFLLGDKTVFFGKKMLIIKQRLEDSSYKAYGIIQNDILLYSAWISLEKLGLPVESNIRLNKNEGLLEDAYCHPKARGRGIHQKMVPYRLFKLYEFGKREAIAIVLNGNAPAYKALNKAGFKDIGIFYACRLFGIPYVFLDKNKFDEVWKSHVGKQRNIF
jgi:GNAT superfamily N-acetyltransferase